MKATLLYIIDPDTLELLLVTKCRGVGAGFLFGYGEKFEDEDMSDGIIPMAIVRGQHIVGKINVFMVLFSKGF